MSCRHFFHWRMFCLLLAQTVLILAEALEWSEGANGTLRAPVQQHMIRPQPYGHVRPVIVALKTDEPVTYRLSHRASTAHFQVGQELNLLCQIRAPTRRPNVTRESEWDRYSNPPSSWNVEWKKNGASLKAETSGVASVGRRLIIRPVSLKDSGTYTCHTGSEMARAYIFVHPRPPLPDVQISPKFVNITEGMSVELQCLVNGVPQPVFVWDYMERLFCKRMTINGNKLRINNANAGDTGTFACIVSNREMVYHEALARVVVHKNVTSGQQNGDEEIRADPSFVSINPRRFKGPVGSTVSLRCNGGGTWLQWRWNNGDVPSKAIYTKGNRQLIIGNAQVEDSGTYSCISQRESGGYNVQATSEVTIIQQGVRRDPGIITVLPDKFRGPVGSTITLTCNRHSASGVNSTVFWNRRDGEMPPRATYANRNHKLTIKNAKVEDSGVYSCTTQHESGEYFVEALSEVTITPQGGEEIKEDPSLITIQPKRFYGPVGSTVTLRCNVMNNAGSLIEWKRLSGKIPSGAIYASENRELTIKEAQASDSGVYICFCQHERGKYYIQATSEIIIIPKVGLETRTEWTDLMSITPAKLEDGVGSTIHLKCKIDESAGPKYSSVQWSKDGREMPATSTYSEGNDEVIISDAQESDSGVYSCFSRHSSDGYQMRATSVIRIIPTPLV